MLLRQLDVDADPQEIARLVRADRRLARRAVPRRARARQPPRSDAQRRRRRLRRRSPIPRRLPRRGVAEPRGRGRRVVPDGRVVLRPGLGQPLRRRAGAPWLGAALGGAATAEPPRHPARRPPGVVPLPPPPRRLPADRARAARPGPFSRHPPCGPASGATRTATATAQWSTPCAAATWTWLSRWCVRWFPAIATAARLYPNTVRWLAMFTDDQLGDRPELMLIAAWATFSVGEPGAAVQWLARASAALPNCHPDDARGPVGAVSPRRRASDHGPAGSRRDGG